MRFHTHVRQRHANPRAAPKFDPSRRIPVPARARSPRCKGEKASRIHGYSSRTVTDPDTRDELPQGADSVGVRPCANRPDQGASAARTAHPTPHRRRPRRHLRLRRRRHTARGWNVTRSDHQFREQLGASGACKTGVFTRQRGPFIAAQRTARCCPSIRYGRHGSTAHGQRYTHLAASSYTQCASSSLSADNLPYDI